MQNKYYIVKFVIFFIVFLVLYPLLDFVWASLITKSAWTLNIGDVAFKGVFFALVFTLIDKAVNKNK